MENLKSLKIQGEGHGRKPGNSWIISNLEAGFERFYDEHGHYPSAPEIDTYEYLPSARQIQRKFGGLMELRKVMSLKHTALNHNSGDIRAKMAGKAQGRASGYEEDYYLYLISKIPELYIHEHKVIRHEGRKTDTDFFIYFPNTNNGVCIDVFYSKDIKTMLRNIRIKELKCEFMPFLNYFVNVNELILQETIDNGISNRNINLPKNIEVYNINFFDSNILPNIVSKFIKS